MAMPGVSWEHSRTINYLNYNNFNELCFVFFGLRANSIVYSVNVCDDDDDDNNNNNNNLTG